MNPMDVYPKVCKLMITQDAFIQITTRYTLTSVELTLRCGFFQKRDVQNVIFLLNVMVGCMVSQILMIFTLELVWQRLMKNVQNVKFVVASKHIPSILKIKLNLQAFSLNYAMTCYFLNALQCKSARQVLLYFLL